MRTNHNYVISLVTADKRREHIKKEFGKYDIPFEFFDAVSPENNLQKLIEKHLPQLKDANLSMGEKGCFMSHIMAWKYCITKEMNYINVFEDDVLLGKDSQDFLANDRWLSDVFNMGDSFILRFETYLMALYPPVEEIKLKNIELNLPSLNGRYIKFLEKYHFGTAGYLITYTAAKKLLDFIAGLSADQLLPIDVLMFKTYLYGKGINNYQLTPALCVQENVYYKEKSLFSSEIEHTPIKETKKLSFLSAIYRLMTKPKRMLNKKRAKNTIIPFS